MGSITTWELTKILQIDQQNPVTLNILHICTADLRHGAGIAAYRLHTALKNAGHTSHLIVAEKTSKDPNVVSLIPDDQPKLYRHIQNAIELGINTCGPQNVFSFFNKALKDHPLVKTADIIHCHNLHWPFKNFPLNFLNIGRTKPLVWTLHDMWPITGHCYHSLDCEKWQIGCKGGCPQLFTFIPLAWDSSPMQWNIKKNIYSRTKFSIITPSQWLTSLVQKSPLTIGHQITTIPNIADFTHFRPRDRALLRKNLGFSENEKLVLFIAGNINVPVKGLNDLLAALKNNNAILLLVGNGEIPKSHKKSIKFRHFNRVKDPDKISEIYNLADVTVVPSTAETFGLVVAESMACGTPVIGSRVGGIPDMIEHKENGFLCEPGNISSLTEGIEYFLLNDEARVDAGKKARDKIVRLCSEENVVAAHVNIYDQEILKHKIT